jgi:hypothetical protein
MWGRHSWAAHQQARCRPPPPAAGPRQARWGWRGLPRGCCRRQAAAAARQGPPHRRRRTCWAIMQAGEAAAQGQAGLAAAARRRRLQSCRSAGTHLDVAATSTDARDVCVELCTAAATACEDAAASPPVAVRGAGAWHGCRRQIVLVVGCGARHLTRRDSCQHPTNAAPAHAAPTKPAHVAPPVEQAWATALAAADTNRSTKALACTMALTSAHPLVASMAPLAMASATARAEDCAVA